MNIAQKQASSQGSKEIEANLSTVLSLMNQNLLEGLIGCERRAISEAVRRRERTKR